MGISLILRQILFTFEAIWRGGGNLIFEWLCFVKVLLFISMECCWREILEGTCLGTHDSSFTHSLFGAERSECALLVDCELFKQVVLLPSLEPEILKKAELKLPVNSLSLLYLWLPVCACLEQSWRPTCKAPTSWTSSRRRWGRPRRSVRSSRRRPKICKENSEWKSIGEKM